MQIANNVVSRFKPKTLHTQSIKDLHTHAKDLHTHKDLHTIFNVLNARKARMKEYVVSIALKLTQTIKSVSGKIHPVLDWKVN